MWMLYAVLLPLIVLQAAWLIRKKMFRDTAVFAAVSLSGFGLWASIASGRPIILNALIGRIIDAAMSLLSG
ncbi:hypothetical protein Theco_2788 [Thermobacillus composti KWC4]|uniref:Uncharacterized protein n=1 Tax=Thermobacillus composti (strain DSM 18247 / JCM 13945 / KWC4) TaxID=717605 RepID=L0EGH0_THECK|nr:hypothetical protein [Thermobacillus composti]AGA58877.1 hypothetical protein Theco_2788 [Thermobacillus composti KWC4]